jgi:hypothetical protein
MMGYQNYLDMMLNEDEDVWLKPKEMAIKVSDYIKNKTGIKDSRENKIGAPDRFQITVQKKYDPNHYSVGVPIENPNEVYLDFYEQKEKSSESLADPKLNYQNTSDRIVKFDKRKIKFKKFNSYESAIKAIDRWFDIK